jgi:hypothetical protein
MARTSDATTATLTDALALGSISAHRLVQPVDAQLHALRIHREEVAEALKSAITRLRELHEQPSSPTQRRACQEEVSKLQEELEEIEFQVRALQPTLDAAKSEARAELRPALKQEAAQLLQNVLRQAEQLLAAQQDLLALDAKTRRLSISLPLGGCVDSCLPGRIKVIRQVLARLQD